MSELREHKCPRCGLVVFFDDARRESHHELPACPWWLQLMRETGGKRAGSLIVTDKGAERIEPKRQRRRRG